MIYYLLTLLKLTAIMLEQFTLDWLNFRWILKEITKSWSTIVMIR